jgi:hypothetical protein
MKPGRMSSKTPSPSFRASCSWSWRMSSSERYAIRAARTMRPGAAVFRTSTISARANAAANVATPEPHMNGVRSLSASRYHSNPELASSTRVARRCSAVCVPTATAAITAPASTIRRSRAVTGDPGSGCPVVAQTSCGCTRHCWVGSEKWYPARYPGEPPAAARRDEAESAADHSRACRTAEAHAEVFHSRHDVVPAIPPKYERIRSFQIDPVPLRLVRLVVRSLIELSDTRLNCCAGLGRRRSA